MTPERPKEKAEWGWVEVAVVMRKTVATRGEAVAKKNARGQAGALTRRSAARACGEIGA